VVGRDVRERERKAGAKEGGTFESTERYWTVRTAQAGMTSFLSRDTRRHTLQGSNHMSAYYISLKDAKDTDWTLQYPIGSTLKQTTLFYIKD
jgi:hypothetical protein